VSSVSRTGAGAYIVTFNRNVLLCAYVATVGGIDTAGAPATGAFAVTGGDSVSPNAVDVATFAANGTTATDNSFHLAVFC
jgi:hypothetical protein